MPKPSVAGNVGKVLRAILTSATTGAAIVAAPGAGLKIRVLWMDVVAAGAVTFALASAATPISSTKALAANGGLVRNPNDHGWFETADNEALNITLGGAVSVGVDIGYVLVKT